MPAPPPLTMPCTDCTFVTRGAATGPTSHSTLSGFYTVRVQIQPLPGGPIAAGILGLPIAVSNGRGGSFNIAGIHHWAWAANAMCVRPVLDLRLQHVRCRAGHGQHAAMRSSAPPPPFPCTRRACEGFSRDATSLPPYSPPENARYRCRAGLTASPPACAYHTRRYIYLKEGDTKHTWNAAIRIGDTLSFEYEADSGPADSSGIPVEENRGFGWVRGAC